MHPNTVVTSLKYTSRRNTFCDFPNCETTTLVINTNHHHHHLSLLPSARVLLLPPRLRLSFYSPLSPLLLFSPSPPLSLFLLLPPLPLSPLPPTFFLLFATLSSCLCLLSLSLLPSACVLLLPPRPRLSFYCSFTCLSSPLPLLHFVPLPHSI